MKINGTSCSIESAYDLLVANEKLVDSIEATSEERERLVTYTILRSNHDYLCDLETARRGR